MPEGLVSQLGARKVQQFIMPGNRLADVDTVRAVISPVNEPAKSCEDNCSSAVVLNRTIVWRYWSKSFEAMRNTEAHI